MILDFFSAKDRLRQRQEWALGPRARTTPAPTVAPAGHLFFNVRSFAAGDSTHTLQFGFVDRDANVVMSVFARAPSPVGPAEEEDGDGALSVEPLAPDALERLLTPLCRGATLVGFHRVLQGGLLPHSTLRAASGFRCTWRRLQDAVVAHGLCSPRERPLTLNDALALAGLDALESEDAAIRALAIRQLWLWLDGLG
jgi:hypothetical protein